jgi:uncharacterized membrane protein YdjX (TVP38/TMEM64 family)
VHPGGGAASIAAGVVCGSFTLFVLWSRLPTVPGLLFTAVCGAAIAAGGLLLQEDAGVGDWILAVAVLASLAALHSRLVFGPPGARRLGGGLLPPTAPPRRKGGNP